MKRDPLAVLIGQNIQRFRRSAGMTQAQLAEKINVSTAFISRVERGEKYVSVKNLAALADEFRVSCDALLRAPGTCDGLETIRVLLEGRSASYVAWVAKILRVCGEAPGDEL